MLPAFFIAHGSPMLAVEENSYTRFLNELGSRMNPRAVVLFSAHWESGTQTISAAPHYRTIHDFGGFPRELYQIEYPARGDQQLSAEISRLLAGSGIPCQTDGERGLDHGAWVVLRLLFPDARIPVVAMSVNPMLKPSEQYRIGKVLSALRADDMLIIGSGGSVHNFGTIRMQAGEVPTDAWAVEFDDWVYDRAARWDLDALFAYRERAPHAGLAVPVHGNEHFSPLFYAMGAADDQRTAAQLHRSYQFGNLSHAVWQFGG